MWVLIIHDWVLIHVGRSNNMKHDELHDKSAYIMVLTHDERKAKITCTRCSKQITRNNMSAHRKTCETKDITTYDQISNQLTTCKEQLKQTQAIVKEKELENEKQRYEIEQLKLEVQHMHTQYITNNNTTNNNTTNNTNDNRITVNVNQYYVMDKHGMRDGLDMTKIRSFGTENVSYVDVTKPLPTILKDIYCNDLHPENKVLSHHYLNLQWILVRYKDHVVRLNLEHDRSNMHIILQMVCENVERLLGKEFKSTDERISGIQELLGAMDVEVRTLQKRVGNEKALQMLPVWNKRQYERTENRLWESYMLYDPNYSQNVNKREGVITV